MKLTRKVRVSEEIEKKIKANRFVLILNVIIIILLIIWVWSLGVKFQRTVKVAMINQDIPKGTVVNKDMFIPYEMMELEYKKLAVIKENGETIRRIILWDDLGRILGSFAAYSLKKGDLAEYRDFVQYKIDSRDLALYSYPGRYLTALKINADDLNIFKTYLRPGDYIGVLAKYTVETKSSEETIEVIKVDTLFERIKIADMLNSEGESVLDLYQWYRGLSAWEQDQMENSQDFKRRITPQNIIVALTREELNKYMSYLNKKNIEFRMILPQRD